MADLEPAPTGVDESRSDPAFLTERRIAGLLGAAVIATIAYWFVTRITAVEAAIFFVVFALVFTGLNYALWRYD